jgi:uncharacterized protein (DUF1697 family)
MTPFIAQSGLSEEEVRARPKEVLTRKLGKHADVIVRTGPELPAGLKANPFPHAEPAKVGILFRTEAVTKAHLAQVVAPGGEEVRLGKRKYYPASDGPVEAETAALSGHHQEPQHGCPAGADGDAVGDGARMGKPGSGRRRMLCLSSNAP